VKHFQREGGCYPDINAVNDNDYKIVRENRYIKMIHHHEVVLPSFSIMPEVVTNGEFEKLFSIKSGSGTKVNGSMGITVL
jgi:hypothetical protein